MNISILLVCIIESLILSSDCAPEFLSRLYKNVRSISTPSGKGSQNVRRAQNKAKYTKDDSVTSSYNPTRLVQTFLKPNLQVVTAAQDLPSELIDPTHLKFFENSIDDNLVTFNSYIPINIIPTYRKLLLRTLKEYLIKLKLKQISQENYDQKIQEICGGLAKVFHDKDEKIDYTDELEIINALKRSNLIYSIIITDPTNLIFYPNLWRQIDFGKQGLCLCDALAIISDDEASSIFGLRILKRISTLKDEDKEEFSKELYICLLRMAIYVSDYKLLLKLSNDLIFTKFLINESMLQNHFIPSLDDYLTTRKHRFISDHPAFLLVNQKIDNLGLKKFQLLSSELLKTLQHIDV